MLNERNRHEVVHAAVDNTKPHVERWILSSKTIKKSKEMVTRVRVVVPCRDGEVVIGGGTGRAPPGLACSVP